MDTQWTQFPDLDSMSDLDFLQMPQDAGLPYDGTDLGFDFSAINNVEPQANTDKGDVERCASQHGTLSISDTDPRCRLLREICSRLENIEQSTPKIEKIDQTVSLLATGLDRLSSTVKELQDGLSHLRQGLRDYVKAVINHVAGEREG